MKPHALTRDTLAAAIQYAQSGWAVIPIRAGGKIPLTEHGVKDASKDELQIRAWWRANPSANVGIATGAASGIVVLDVDPRSGGDLSGLDVPATLTAITGGGGHHYLFRAPGGPMRGRTGWRPGLDVKADGGYIVAAPSSHASGGFYSWVDPSVAVAPAPAWLLEAMSPPAPLIPINRGSVRSDAQVRRVRAYVARMPASVQGSNGSADLMRVAGRLAAEEADGKISSDDSWAILLEYNARAEPPWSERELEHAMGNARRSPRQTPLEDRTPTPMPQQSEFVPGDSWMQALLWNKNGTALQKCTANAITILRGDPRWKGKVRMDEFTWDIRVTDAPFERKHLEFWEENDDTLLQGWLLREHGIHLSVHDCARAVIAAAKSDPIHPVRDWMDTLKWDGVERLSRWLVTYLGAEDTEYTRAVGRWWLISAVARVYEPGSQVHHVLVLQGEQGIGKSSALRTITGAGWFSDTPLDIGNKDTYQVIQGRLVVEFSDLEGIRGVHADKLKSFFSSPTDRFRSPFTRKPADFRRQCVFAATTNSREFLLDHTGGRRYWPVWCTRLDNDALKRDRAQIWAEAVTAYGKHERWWPETAEEHAMVGEQQEERRVVDAREQLVNDWLNARNRDFVSTEEILLEALHLTPDSWDGRSSATVSRIMRALGWNTARRRISGVLKRGYEKSAEF